MSCPDRLSQWKQEVHVAFRHLSKPQVWGLVRMSARELRCREPQESRKSVLCSQKAPQAFTPAGARAQTRAETSSARTAAGGRMTSLQKTYT